MSEARPAGGQLSPERQALVALRTLRGRLEEVERARTEPLAVVGMACRFPGAPDARAFWDLLRQGRSAVTEVPRERWPLDRYYDPNPDAPGRMYTRFAALVDGIDRFDPLFFGISPREAVAMDPQQRMLLEVAWEALEDAGQAPYRLMGSNTGVFVGITAHDYAERQLKVADSAPPDVYYGTGNALSCAVGRLSYVLGLVGPNITVDTACSASMVAVHLAVQSLRNGECRMAIAGGVNVILSPDVTVNLCRARMLAADGRCKTFDAAADGYVRGEGCGVIVLKRLSDAVADRDRILALVRGTAVNQDGRTSGFTAPNELSQAALIRAALASGRVDPQSVSYIEAHGTGTPLGDPIEIQALGAVFGNRAGTPLTVGSVKTNIGHLEPAAGIAGLIKVILSMRHKHIPAHLHFNALNPHIAASRVPIAIPTTLTPWTVAGPRIAGVSSFGFSGTNAHAVLEEAPASDDVAGRDDRGYVLVLSARSDEALGALTRSFAESVAALDDAALGDACFTAAAGRSHFPHRAAIVAASPAELRGQLAAAAAGESPTGVFRRTAPPGQPPDVAFLFTGQGSQYAGMARSLYDKDATFRKTLDACEARLRGLLDRSLVDLLSDGAAIDQTAYAQPALFSIEYALAETWRSWGIEPCAVLGHSLGEYVAACVAGVFSLDDALALVAARGRLMQALPTAGAMAAIGAESARVAATIGQRWRGVAIAAVNGPQDTVVSGAPSDVEAIVETFSAEGVECRRLAVSLAFHSAALDPMLAEFERLAAGVTFSSPRMAIVSNLTGRFARPDEMTRASYWRQHARGTVQFAAGLDSLWAQGCRVFVEIGPAPVLVGLGQRAIADAAAGTWLASLRRGRDDWQQMLESYGQLYTNGVQPNWKPLDPDRSRRKIALPTYPFQRDRYWIDESHAVAPAAAPSTGSDRRLPGARLRAALPTFELTMTAQAPIVAAHTTREGTVLSAAGYIDLALAAAVDVFGRQRDSLAEIVITQPLVLSEEPRTVQVIVDTRASGDATVEVFSTDRSASSWSRHARGTVRQAAAPAGEPESLSSIRRRCASATTGSVFYDSLAASGFTVGADDRRIEELRSSAGEVLVHVRLDPESSGRRVSGHALDASLLALAPLVSGFDDGAHNMFVVAAAGRIVLADVATPTVWVHAQLTQAPTAGNRTAVANLRLYDAVGGVVGELSGIELKRVRAEAGDSAVPRDWLYDAVWEPRGPARRTGAAAWSSEGVSDAATSVRTLATEVLAAEIVGAADALDRMLHRLAGDYVAAAFAALGCEFTIGERFQSAALFDRLRILPRYRRLFDRLLEMLEEDGVVRQEDADWIVIATPAGRDLSVAAGELVAMFPRSAPQIRLMTRCAARLADALRGTADAIELLFPGGQFDEVEQIYRDLPLARAFQALLKDMVAALVARRSTDAPIRVLEVGGGTGSSTAAVLPALPADRTEYLFTDVSPAFVSRAEREFAAYPFVRSQVLDIESDPTAQGFEGGVFDIVIAANVLHATTDLASTCAHVRRLLAPGGVLIAMEATERQRWVDLTFGLTDGWWRFTDVALRSTHPLLSRGRWRDFLGGQGFDTVSMVPGVEDQTLPEQTIIVARAAGAGSSSADRGRGWVLVVDEEETRDAFARAIEARGDSAVIVSTSAAGAGLCADVAKHVSHSLATFAVVDVVYVSSMAPGSAAGEGTGCAALVELLKAVDSVNVPERVRLWAVTRGAQPVDGPAQPLLPAQATLWGLGRAIGLEHPSLWGGLIDLDPRCAPAEDGDEAVAAIADGPLEDQVAVRGGRLFVPRIVPARDAATGLVTFDPSASYIVTGGLGRLGLLVARWMAERGAKHLALVSRRALPERASWAAAPVALRPRLRQIEAIEALGATVTIVAADVADREAMRAALDRIAAIAPIRGIVHAAADPSVAHTITMDATTLAAMLRPKVDGTLVLHELTLDYALDFFVMFSSTTALWSVSGLGHYAAANQFLDAFAHYRRALGLKATSINWGTWDADDDGAEEYRQQSIGVGLRPIDASSGLAALGYAIAADLTAKTIASVEWSRFQAVYEAKRRRPFFDRVRGTTVKPSGAPSTTDVLRKLRDARPSDRRERLAEHVRAEVARVLRLSASTPIPPTQGLFEMGMDSLMSVELRSRLEATLAVQLPSTLTFNYPNIEALVGYLSTKVDGAPRAPKAVEAPASNSTTPASAVTATMSEDELAQILAERLQNI